MAKKRSSRRQQNRGCLGLLPIALLVLSLAGCAWGFYLGNTRAGQEVTFGTGVSFYAGWFCGVTGFLFALILAVANAFTRFIGQTVDAASDQVKGIGKQGQGGAAGNMGGLGRIGGILAALGGLNAFSSGNLINQFLGSQQQNNDNDNDPRT
ncbi:MAG: hypothetical protein ACOYL5_09085 [Phototrophicaceae bacterium]|jgi:hypothetical protein